MPTDFRDGRTFPRRGREPLGQFLWLARVYDKSRAFLAGTIHDYIYPCPMDQGVMERWGVSRDEFEKAVNECHDDAAILRWADSRIGKQGALAANSWVSVEQFAHLDKQDREEGVFA